MTFLAPVSDHEQKVNGIKKWDHAFRVYAAIFCGANLLTAKEIWQYIYIIHSAAASYQWDNVAFYDYSFRQMMSERPNRNWGKTYTQLWQLALHDPINKQNESNRWSSGQHQQHQHGSSTATAGPSEGMATKHKDWCCWTFNRVGKCEKPGCKFDNCCSYCGTWNTHGSNTCKKKLGSKK